MNTAGDNETTLEETSQQVATIEDQPHGTGLEAQVAEDQAHDAGFRAAVAGADSLAAGVAILLALTVIQKGVGFVRGLIFCRWLSPYELGQWDLAFSFLMMAVPVAILGITGSFGRYVEHFRQRGQFFGFFRKTLGTIVTLALVGAGIVLLGRETFSWVIFDNSSMTTVVITIVACMLVITMYNYLVEMFFALRQSRIASLMEFSTSMIFATLGLSLLYYWRCNAIAVLLAYGGAVLFSSLWGLAVFRSTLRKQPRDTKGLSTKDLWSKLAPFAAWVWMINVLANLFVIVDRYMIMHFSGMGSFEAAETVGAYHSSRVVPWLLATVATMLSTVALPHLTRHWENGDKDGLSRKVNLILKLVGLLLMSGALCILIGGNFLFEVAFMGKFPIGRDVLPWTTALCMWFGLTALAQMYLWCAEKARLSCIAIGFGLVFNIFLNYILLPPMGLMGAVLATAAANYIVIVLTLRLNRKVGMRVEWGTWIIVTAPAGFGYGLWGALLTMTLLGLFCIHTDWVLSRNDKDKIREIVNRGHKWITARIG